MALKQYIIVENGSVKAKSRDGIVHRVYYNKGNSVPAVRADWEEYEKSVSVLLENGKMLIISNNGIVLKRI